MKTEAGVLIAIRIGIKFGLELRLVQEVELRFKHSYYNKDWKIKITLIRLRIRLKLSEI